MPAWFSSWSPDDREILSSRPALGHRPILTAYSLADGKLRTVASFPDALADDPEFSADGRQIVFQLSRRREARAVADARGRRNAAAADEGRRGLASPLQSAQPGRGPLHARSQAPGHRHVGTGEVRLIPGYAEGNYILDYPSWSPDGSRVYFSVYRKTGDIFLLEDF